MYARLGIGARRLNYRLSFHPCLLFVYTSSEGSGETARTCSPEPLLPDDYDESTKFSCAGYQLVLSHQVVSEYLEF